MKFNLAFGIYLITAFNFLSTEAKEQIGQSCEELQKGKWIALSNATVSVLGDTLIIEGNKLKFSKAGKFTFRVKKTKDGFSVLNFQSKLADCYFAIIGPVKTNGEKPSSKKFEFALYQSEEFALKAIESHDLLESCSLWGVYINE